MALFDSPERSDAEEAENAVKAAIAMQETLKIYNQDRVNSGYKSISVGIGIHSGEVIIGTVGSTERMESTVLGDNVNVASRMEGLTKYYGAGILISDTTLELLNDPDAFQYRELDWIQVKGREEPVRIYEILDSESQELQDLKRASGSMILEGLQHRKRKEWDAAAAAFQKALNAHPEDLAAKLHCQHCQQLRKEELSDDWDGSFPWDQK